MTLIVWVLTLGGLIFGLARAKVVIFHLDPDTGRRSAAPYAVWFFSRVQWNCDLGTFLSAGTAQLL